jgi:hypothetical protein
VPFGFRTFFRMFRLAFADHPSPRRRKVVWTLLFLIPALSAVNAVCFALDRLVFPGYRKVKVRSPVFIIGHARSGTSLMHRLMSRDGERFSHFTMYEMFVPSLIQKKLIRFLGECDRRYWGETISRRIRAWEDPRGRGDARPRPPDGTRLSSRGIRPDPRGDSRRPRGPVRALRLGRHVLTPD